MDLTSRNLLTHVINKRYNGTDTLRPIVFEEGGPTIPWLPDHSGEVHYTP